MKRVVWMVEKKTPSGWVPWDWCESRSGARRFAQSERATWGTVTRIRKYIPEDAK